MLLGVGLSEEELSKPQVGISSVWYEGNPCNMHLLRLSEAVKEGVLEAGMVGFRFNTIGVSDAISMGTQGMSYSLQSRDLIADSIETVMSAQWYDANIAIPGCDKNVSLSLSLSYSLMVFFLLVFYDILLVFFTFEFSRSKIKALCFISKSLLRVWSTTSKEKRRSNVWLLRYMFELLF